MSLPGKQDEITKDKVEIEKYNIKYNRHFRRQAERYDHQFNNFYSLS